jgi:hypothetical protein
MRRWLAVVGFGIAGILVAIALSLGAFALAGKDIGEPASTVNIVASTPTPERSGSPKPEQTEQPGHKDDKAGGSTPTATVDDPGGGSGSTEGGTPSTSGPGESGSDSSGSGSEHGGSDDHGEDD